MVKYVDLGKEIFEKIQDTDLHLAIYLERKRERTYRWQQSENKKSKKAWFKVPIDTPIMWVHILT